MLISINHGFLFSIESFWKTGTTHSYRLPACGQLT
jgi:hypothetical protein